MKKAQGALEFLMTYGWAFLVILIMIGALAYFGILNPSKFLPDKCMFGSEVLCKKGEFVINAKDDATVIAKVVNQFGASVIISAGEFKTDNENIGTGGVCTACLNDAGELVCPGTSGPLDALEPPVNPPTNPITWQEGATKVLVANCPNAEAALTKGDKIRFTFTGKWYPSTSSADFSHTFNGEVYATVQAQ